MNQEQLQRFCDELVVFLAVCLSMDAIKVPHRELASAYVQRYQALRDSKKGGEDARKSDRS